MTFIRLSKEDAKREAGISFTDLKAVLLVVTTAFGAYFLIQDEIQAAEQRAVQAFEKTARSIEITQIEFRLDVLYDRRDRIKTKYTASTHGITPSDSAILARTQSQISRLEAKLIYLDSIE